MRCTRIGTAIAFVIACVAGPGPTRLSAQTSVEHSTQLVVVTTADWDSTTGELRRFVRDDVASSWRREGSVVPVVIGRAGLAWGAGFDDLADAASPATAPRKREGDGRSPAGVFPLGDAFGFAAADSMPWIRLPYVPLTATSECVDDTTSVHYNTVVDRNAVSPIDWSSAEQMREIEVYRLGVIVDYNAAPRLRARGSCIFLHIWSGPGSTTSGCTALDEAELAGLMAWLDPQARPVVVQVPAAMYARLRGEWGLPALDGAGS